MAILMDAQASVRLQCHLRIEGSSNVTRQWRRKGKRSSPRSFRRQERLFQLLGGVFLYGLGPMGPKEDQQRVSYDLSFCMGPLGPKSQQYNVSVPDDVLD